MGKTLNIYTYPINYLRGNRLKFEGDFTHDDLMYFVKRLGNDKTYTLD